MIYFILACEKKSIGINLADICQPFPQLKIPTASKQAVSKARQKISADASFHKEVFKELYFLRWGIESRYREIKTFFNLESFNGYKLGINFFRFYSLWDYYVRDWEIVQGTGFWYIYELINGKILLLYLLRNCSYNML